MSLSWITLRDMITEVEIALRQVPGAAVQTYAEDAIVQAIDTAFRMLYNKQRWNAFRTRTDVALDGATGLVTTDIPNLYDFGDIETIYVQNMSIPLQLLPTNFNVSLLQGTQPIYVENFFQRTPPRLFRVWPLTASGNITLVYQRNFPRFTLSDLDIYIEWNPITVKYLAAMFYATVDGTTPGAISTFQNLYQQAYEDDAYRDANFRATLGKQYSPMYEWTPR